VRHGTPALRFHRLLEDTRVVGIRELKKGEHQRSVRFQNSKDIL
jgi:hypothetical protein